MKKIILILSSIIIITGCNKTTDEVYTSYFEKIDNAFSTNNIQFSRDAKLNEENYYAKEGWQYVIDDATCIVDIYYYGEDNENYKEAYDTQSIVSKEYGNIYITAIVNKGFGSIIWNGCSKTEEIKNILENL